MTCLRCCCSQSGWAAKRGACKVRGSNPISFSPHIHAQCPALLPEKSLEALAEPRAFRMSSSHNLGLDDAGIRPKGRPPLKRAMIFPDRRFIA